MRVIRTEAHRRISWLIAEKSFKRKFIGMLARAIGTVPVARAMDNLKPGQGTIYLPDPVNQPTVIRGVDTNFEAAGYEKDGTIALPTINGTSHSATIAEIRGPQELVIKKPFKHRDALFQLTGRRDIADDGTFTGDVSGQDLSDFKGTKFKVAPHVDQTAVYEAVFARLNAGGCVGIFPEGGSHDRPGLLPLKGTMTLTDGGSYCGCANALTCTLASSWRCSYGSRYTGRQSRLWAQDCPVRNELFSRAQVSIPGRR